MSPGIARGPTHVVRDDLDDVARYRIEPVQIANEIGRFEAALIQTRVQILELQQKIAESIGAKDAGIFDAHLLVVEDRTLIDEVLRKLEADLCNVEWIFQEVASKYIETLGKMDDPYLRERALDIQDVMKRVIRNLQGKTPRPLLALTEPHILVAHNLTPSDTATMNKERVLGSEGESLQRVAGRGPAAGQVSCVQAGAVVLLREGGQLALAGGVRAGQVQR